MGCVLYEMATQQPPFVGHDLKALKRNIIAGVYKKLPARFTDDLDKFIRMCLKVDPKDRLSASELLDNDLLKRRNSLKDHFVNDSMNLSSSGNYSCQMISKINVRRRDIRNIKGMLPKHKFGDHSVDKITENKSYCEEKNKENSINSHNFIQSSKITKKDQLPSIKRSSSLHGKQDAKIKMLEEKIMRDERPPIPRSRPIRA